MMDVYGASDVGRVRTLNEDSFCIFGMDEQQIPGLCVLSDGMGGHNAGEVASQKTVQFIVEALRDKLDLSRDAVPVEMKRAVEYANGKVFKMASDNQSQHGMGATLVLAVILDSVAYLANVGDSRAYAYRNGELIQITKDHSMVEEMVMNGVITLEEAKVHPQRNMITRAVGTDPSVEPDLFEYDYLPGDILLLCSDGLSGMIEDDQMITILEENRSAKEKVSALIDAANQNGGRDNITAICIQFMQEG